MTRAEIQAHLTTQLLGRRIHTYLTADSTNTLARELASRSPDVAEGMLVLAEGQTAGRGRFGRSWHSDPGANLTFSVVLRPALPPEKLGLVPLAAGAAVARAVTSLGVSLSPCCVWPNDVLLSGKKFCGILCETLQSQDGSYNIIAGIGINVNQRTFPEGLSRPATSLALEAGRDIHRAAFLGSVLGELELTAYASPENILREWRKAASAVLGGRVRIAQAASPPFEAVAEDVDADGALLVRTGDRLERVLAADVTILKGGNGSCS